MPPPPRFFLSVSEQKTYSTDKDERAVSEVLIEEVRGGDASNVGGGKPLPPQSPAGRTGVEASRIKQARSPTVEPDKGYLAARASLSYRTSVLIGL